MNFESTEDVFNREGPGQETSVRSSSGKSDYLQIRWIKEHPLP